MPIALAEALNRVQVSPGMQATLARAVGFSRTQGAPVVSLEHALLSLIDDAEAGLVLQASSVDLERLRAETTAHLGRQTVRGPAGGSDAEPLLSDELARILDYAQLAARQSRRNDVTGAIVLAAIIGEGQSAAAQLLRAQNLTFDEAIRAIREPPAKTQSAPAAAPPAVQPAAAAGMTPETEAILSAVRERLQAPRPAVAEASLPRAILRAEASPQPQREPALAPAPMLSTAPPPAMSPNSASEPVQHSRLDHLEDVPPTRPPVRVAVEQILPPPPVSAPAPMPMPQVAALPFPPAPRQAPSAIPLPRPPMGPRPVAAPARGQPNVPAGRWAPEQLGLSTIHPEPPGDPRGPFGRGRGPAVAPGKWDLNTGPPRPGPEPGAPEGYGDLVPVLPQPAPAPPAGAPRVELRAPLGLSGSQIAVSLPLRVRLDRAELGEVRISKAALVALETQTLAREDRSLPGRVVARFVSVRVSDHTRRIAIVPESPETVPLDGRMSGGTEAQSSWRFRLQGGRPGRADVHVSVVLRTILNDGGVIELVQPTTTPAVRVAGRPGALAVRILTWLALLAAGIAIGIVGPQLMDILRALGLPV